MPIDTSRLHESKPPLPSDEDVNRQDSVNGDVNIWRFNVGGLLISLSPDWLWNTIIYMVGSFFLIALVVLGGRDILLLMAGNTASATQVQTSKKYLCGSNRNGARGIYSSKVNYLYCYDVTYSFQTSDSTQEIHLEYKTGSTIADTIMVRYVTWQPSIYKVDSGYRYHQKNQEK